MRSASCPDSLLLIRANFPEEVFMNLKISREAALQIIREHLQYIGNPKPSQRDLSLPRVVHHVERNVRKLDIGIFVH